MNGRKGKCFDDSIEKKFDLDAPEINSKIAHKHIGSHLPILTKLVSLERSWPVE
jgi:hypothetical protein